MSISNKCSDDEHEDCRDGGCWCDCHPLLGRVERLKLRKLLAEMDEREASREEA